MPERPHRRPEVELPFAGQVDPETGRKRCVWCGTPVQGRRIRWCSDECVLHYRIAKGDQGACRRHVWKQDRGVCQLCRTDVNKLRRALVAEHGRVPKDRVDEISWDADHRDPIIEGGKLEPGNLRTLCRRCHKAETKALRQRMAAKAKRRVQKRG